MVVNSSITDTFLTSKVLLLLMGQTWGFERNSTEQLYEI